MAWLLSLSLALVVAAFCSLHVINERYMIHDTWYMMVHDGFVDHCSIGKHRLYFWVVTQWLVGGPEARPVGEPPAWGFWPETFTLKWRRIYYLQGIPGVFGRASWFRGGLWIWFDIGSRDETREWDVRAIWALWRLHRTHRLSLPQLENANTIALRLSPYLYSSQLSVLLRCPRRELVNTSRTLTHTQTYFFSATFSRRERVRGVDVLVVCSDCAAWRSP